MCGLRFAAAISKFDRSGSMQVTFRHPLDTTASANDPICAPTSMTMSPGAKRSGNRYSLRTNTPLKIA
jgi:hypothetical protein